jgi:TatD DNase family protein
LIDSHCHLQHLEPEAREREIDEARSVGVTGFLVPATRLDEADDVLDLCHRHPDVWCALGVHPHEAATWGDGAAGRLRALLEDPKVVAVGECGLDFHYMHAPREVQERALLDQLRIAIESDLPAVVHNRESDDAMLDLLRQPGLEALRADFHSFAGNGAMQKELSERGFCFGFSGMVTFAKADNIRALLAATPAERILLETDTPFLAPKPHRGKPNRPAFLPLIAARVAGERGMETAALVTLADGNFRRLFRPGSERR